MPHADVVTFTTHKALRGPRGAMILCREEHAKAIDKAVFPMMQGGPHREQHRRQGRRAQGGDDAGVRATTRSAIVRDARALAAGLADEGLRIVSGGTDSHLALADVRPLGIGRQDGRGASATRSGSRSTRTRSRTTRTRRRRRRGSAWARRARATLGMDEPEMREIAGVIGEVLRAPATTPGAKDKARGARRAT